MTKQLSIFGSTGSIGTNTLALVEACPDQFDVKILVAGSHAGLLAEQALRHRPETVGLASEEHAAELTAALAGSGIEIVIGEAACTALARRPVDVVVAGIVGLAGLPSVIAALECGKTVALANKESLVSAGALVTRPQHKTAPDCFRLTANTARFSSAGSDGRACRKGGAPIGTESIRSICLTASGGPFRDRPLDSFGSITPAEAVRHPNWSMGRKISVDSATMMNKGSR